MANQYPITQSAAVGQRHNLHEEMPGLTVVIPAYNEASGIGAVVNRLSTVLTAAGLPFEIIVVDDGSEDGTGDIARQAVGVKVYRHPRNRGYGAALKTGIRRAQYDTIVMTDADGTYPCEAVPQLVALFHKGHHDMVVGSRTGARVAVPLLRRPGKWIIGHLAEYVAGMPIPDINSGLRVLRRDSVLQLLQLLPDGFSFTTTITLAMMANGFSVEYSAIDYYPRVGRSKIRPIQDMLNFVQLILRMALYFAPLKIFIPFSLFLFAVALIWGLVSKFVLGEFADVSTVIVVSLGLQVFTVGLLADLIDRRLLYHSDSKRKGGGNGAI